MISQITSLLALISMLLHSVLGCCWHHAHECDSRVVKSKVVCQSKLDSCVGNHDDAHRGVNLSHASHRHSSEVDSTGENATGEQREAPCDHDTPCHERRCSFLDAVVLVSPVVIDLEWAWSSTSFVSSELMVLTAGDSEFQCDFEASPPTISSGQVRGLYQVWLV